MKNTEIKTNTLNTLQIVHAAQDYYMIKALEFMDNENESDNELAKKFAHELMKEAQKHYYELSDLIRELNKAPWED